MCDCLSGCPGCRPIATDISEPWCTCEPLWTGEAPPVPDRHCPVHGEGT